MAFSKQYRITALKDFERLREAGSFINAGSFFLKIFNRKDDCPSRFAVIASRKTGGAVERNLLKRRAKAIFLANYHLCPIGFDVLWVARSSMKQQAYASLLNSFKKIAGAIYS